MKGVNLNAAYNIINKLHSTHYRQNLAFPSSQFNTDFIKDRLQIESFRLIFKKGNSQVNKR